jgi:hypothetical protein
MIIEFDVLEVQELELQRLRRQFLQLKGSPPAAQRAVQGRSSCPCARPERCGDCTSKSRRR